MKRLFLSVAALALTVGAAFAADLPARKGPPVLPPPPPPPMWTGFYAGVNAGGTWANSNSLTIGVTPLGFDRTLTGTPRIAPATYWTNDWLAAFASAATPGGFGSGSNGGFVGGGQVGYNWQLMNNFVAGFEADIQGVAGSSASHSFATAIPTPFGAFAGVHSARRSLDFIGTVRGRLGWLVMPTLLVYGTGGFAYAGASFNSATTVSNNFFAPEVFPGAYAGVNFNDTRTGWTAGGGLEWMFWPNWSAKVEYLYYDLGSVTQNYWLSAPVAVTVPGRTAGTTVTVTDTASFGGQLRAQTSGNIVRAGLNYHFNWGAPAPAPVVAKY
jgi:outer membrane immunogenic protein